MSAHSSSFRGHLCHAIGGYVASQGRQTIIFASLSSLSPTQSLRLHPSDRTTRRGSRSRTFPLSLSVQTTPQVSPSAPSTSSSPHIPIYTYRPNNPPQSTTPSTTQAVYPYPRHPCSPHASRCNKDTRTLSRVRRHYLPPVSSIPPYPNS
jgi:hypothetical protein